MSRKKKCSFTLWAPFAPSRFSGSWNPQVSVNSKRFSYLCQKPADSLSRFSGQLLRPKDRWLGDKIFYKPFQAGMWLLSLLYLCRADLSFSLGNGKVHSLLACCRAQFQEPTLGPVPCQIQLSRGYQSTATVYWRDWSNSGARKLGVPTHVDVLFGGCISWDEPCISCHRLCCHKFRK